MTNRVRTTYATPTSAATSRPTPVMTTTCVPKTIAWKGSDANTIPNPVTTTTRARKTSVMHPPVIASSQAPRVMMETHARKTPASPRQAPLNALIQQRTATTTTRAQTIHATWPLAA